MKCVTFGCAVGVVAFAISSLGMSRPAAAADKPPPEPAVVEEILRVLNEKGLLDEDEYSRLTARYAASEQGAQEPAPEDQVLRRSAPARRGLLVRRGSRRG